MSITVKGHVVNPTELTQPVPSAPVAVVETQVVRPSISQNIPNNSGPINPLNYVKAEARATMDPSKTYILVDGKVKEISKKSQYLFDMITK
jgi:hypothetical protein